MPTSHTIRQTNCLQRLDTQSSNLQCLGLPAPSKFLPTATTKCGIQFRNTIHLQTSQERICTHNRTLRAYPGTKLRNTRYFSKLGDVDHLSTSNSKVQPLAVEPNSTFPSRTRKGWLEKFFLTSWWSIGTNYQPKRNWRTVRIGRNTPSAN